MEEKSTASDFRIRFNNDDFPIDIIWMTYYTKKRLLQNDDIPFLYAQKCQYNKLCWPYIGLIVKTSKNKIRVIAEYVVINDNIDTYQ